MIPRRVPEATLSAQPITIAVLGSSESAVRLIRAISELGSAHLAEVWTPNRESPSAVAAREAGAAIRVDLSDAARQATVDLVVDATGDERAHAAVSALLPPSVELLGADSAQFLEACLEARGAAEHHVLGELRQALDRVGAQERRLLASKESLERANAALEKELAEMYFMHEFSTSLTAYTDPKDVCALIVDGANGVFGAEVSAVYLVDSDTWTFRRCACQGRSESSFADALPVESTILGEAFSAGFAQHASAGECVAAGGWLTESGLRSAAAVSLKAGEVVVAVLVIGAFEQRTLDAAEVERFRGMADQSALALQNALLHRELERLSATDRLTGLHNRGYLEQRLEAEFSRTARFGRELALIMLDIDDFKSYNDTYGHQAGDQVLREASAVIRDNLRDMDVAARYGGEEFVIVLPETTMEGAAGVAERIRVQIESLRFCVDGETPAHRTASFGVAALPTHADDVDGLIRLADEAMYRAKRSGKNRVESAQGSREDDTA